MTEATAHVPEPDLTLREGMPVSAQFDDVYFSRAGGVAETSHVFLAGNGLPERFRDASHFTIGELGFGTGLNFLVTLKAFRETAAADAMLDYIAVEKYPFRVETLREILALQPELATEAAELLAAYPPRLPGMHHVSFGRVRLTWCFGDVAALLPLLDGFAVDAWFLDGFSPAKNPGMWEEKLYGELRRLSKSGTSFATFTAAGVVKRGLMAAGFAVEKAAGFGHKRDMLRGVMEHQTAPAKKSLPRTAIVIGGGIAGASVAQALAARGLSVTVLERHQIASGASGNAAGVLFPQVSKRWNASSAWYFTAYGFALRRLQQSQNVTFATPCMLRLPRTIEEENQLRALQQHFGLDPAIAHWVERDAASEIAGVELKNGAAYFPQGSWVSPHSWCHALLQHEKIILREHAAAISVQKNARSWLVTLANGETVEAEILCVASAAESVHLLSNYGLRLNEVGGQISEIAAADVAAPLRSILCHKGYVIPAKDRYYIGATYHREDMLSVTPARHDENCTELENILPGWRRGEPVGGRSAVRATTPDRLPYVGALEDGLYVSTGHGSRGLLSAPLAAEMIASAVLGEPAPVMPELARALDPRRFIR